MGINSVSTKAVTGMNSGADGVSLLLGRIQRYRVRSPSLRGCTSGKLLGHGGQLLGRPGSGWLGRAGEQGEFQPIRVGKIENLLSFSKSFINLKSI
jgi:hypothetical protein